ncbi:unnamed protein product [Cuscuta campestris]|uniref:Uncharacterized protein n=1 Tax=Cuscuta campestris TaxID=132261 RepID=A0A484L3A5_9ASTE|nr:unnamed protein product [Cuscuta campestris]
MDKIGSSWEGSQPSSSSHSESSSPPVTPLIRRPSHQSSSQAQEIVAQEPVPLNQLPGRFNPKILSWDQWEERLGSLGFLALDVRPVFKESSRVTKKVLAEWADRVIKPERVHPEPTKDLEDACEKLLKGDPVTRKPYAYGGWVFRLPNQDGDVFATHDAGDDRADSPDGHAEAGSPHPDMDFNRMTTIIEDDDDDVEVLNSHRSPNRNPPSPPQNIGVEGASIARCSSFDDLIRDKQVKSPSALHFSEGDRVESKPKEASHSSSRAKGQKRKGSHKSSKGGKKKKTGSLDLEGESVEEAFLALTRRLQKVGVLSEEIGQSLIEPTNQVSQLNLLLDSAKSEINDLVERERKLEVELRAERALLEEERARSTRLEEEGKRKVAELEEALAQAEETARSKEEAFPDDAAIWAACHHTERGGLTGFDLDTLDP